jgi:hypothetical protein
MAVLTVNGKTFVGSCYAVPHVATAAGRITPVAMNDGGWITLSPESFNIDFSAKYGKIAPDGASFTRTENQSHPCTW